MANFRRNLPAARGTRHSVKSMHSEPKWWTVLFHTRPRRRKGTRQQWKLMAGADPDDLVFPLGNHKPHNYFW